MHPISRPQRRVCQCRTIFTGALQRDSRRLELEHRAELAELRVAVVDDLGDAQLLELAQVAADRRTQVLRRERWIAVGAARRLVDQLIDEAQLEAVPRRE